MRIEYYKAIKGEFFMKRLARWILLMLALVSSLTGCGIKGIGKSKGSLSEKQKLEDFQYMHDVLKENYPYFSVNSRTNEIDWLKDKKRYDEMIKATSSNEEFFSVLETILGELDPAYVGMISKEFYDEYQGMYEKDSVAYEAWGRELNKETAKARYKGMTNEENKNQDYGEYVDPNNVRTEIVKENNVAYLNIKSFSSSNIKPDMEKIRPFLQNVKNYPSLIIDIRQSGGGDISYWADNLLPMLINKPLESKNYKLYRGGSFSEDFMKTSTGKTYKEMSTIDNLLNLKLPAMPTEVGGSFKYYIETNQRVVPNNPIGFKGKIYLLVNRNVYTSSEMFAGFAKNTGFVPL